MLNFSEIKKTSGIDPLNLPLTKTTNLFPYVYVLCCLKKQQGIVQRKCSFLLSLLASPSKFSGGRSWRGLHTRCWMKHAVFMKCGQVENIYLTCMKLCVKGHPTMINHNKPRPLHGGGPLFPWSSNPAEKWELPLQHSPAIWHVCMNFIDLCLAAALLVMRLVDISRN